MSQKLTVSIGQCSDKGRKEINQDFHGALFPVGAALGLKGITIALADGISSSAVSQIAAQSAVKSLLTDYYATADSWTVKTSALRVFHAANSWLYAQTRRSGHRYDMDRGYVCTLSALILKSRYAYIFHVGDSRIYRLSGDHLEQLTNDHRSVLSASESYLARAMGMAQSVDIEYRRLGIAVGDVFILVTDGVYEHMDARFAVRTVREHGDELDIAASLIVKHALEKGSRDNLTIQIVRVESLPDGEALDFIDASQYLPAAPLLEPRQEFEGYRIERQIYASSRSHIYLATHLASDQRVALKIPSIDMRENRAYLKRFMMEEWIARRMNNTYVLSALPPDRARGFVYVVMEYLEGQTLTQWMVDNPKPELEQVRGIIEQIAKGLRAFHRKEMLHQDLRPENVIIDRAGTAKIIDFGAAKVAGVQEARAAVQGEEVLGTLQYTAPECFIGQAGSRQSDFFSLGVIAYQMLTGRLPYGTQVSKVRTAAQQRKLRYVPAGNHAMNIPQHIDAVLKKSVHPDPLKRYQTLSEFTADLRAPDKGRRGVETTPLAERNPVVFWQVVSGTLAIGLLYLLAR